MLGLNMGLDFCIRGNRASYKGNDALVLYHEWSFSVRFNFYQKNNQSEFFLKKIKNGSNRFGSIFSIFGSVWLGFGLVFSGFDLVFSIWLVFFPVLLGFFFVWARFGFFLFFAYKTEPVGFFKILISLIGFFLQFGFFGYFFPGFFGFFIFLLTSMLYGINCSYNEHLTWWW
jgi:hypothetical protein